jgi:hypothetical protein
MSLPYPEAGVRLIRQDRIDDFAAKMRELQEELAEAVEALDRRYSELKAIARQRLGSLFNAADCPQSLVGMFAVEFDFPSVEPPPYLQQLNPQLYEQECQRVQSRFDEAVRLAEEAFTAELAKLVSHLTERLSGQEDGKPKIFRDGIVGNLNEFFQRFRELNVRSNEQLDQLVSQAQRVIRGVEPHVLRDNAGLRQHVATEMSQVQSVLDGLLAAMGYLTSGPVIDGLIEVEKLHIIYYCVTSNSNRAAVPCGWPVTPAAVSPGASASAARKTASSTRISGSSRSLGPGVTGSTWPMRTC